jgi:hypothetical protein
MKSIGKIKSSEPLESERYKPQLAGSPSNLVTNMKSHSVERSNSNFKLTRSSSTQMIGTNPLQKKESLKVDNFLYQKYHPKFNMERKRNQSIHSLNPTEIEISSLVVKLEQSRQQFKTKLERINQTSQNDILKSLAEMKLPKNAGNIQGFMKSTRKLLSQLK